MACTDASCLECYPGNAWGLTAPTFSTPREKALAALKECETPGDTEASHQNADKALCDLLAALGYEDVIEAWRNIDKWYA